MKKNTKTTVKHQKQQASRQLTLDEIVAFDGVQNPSALKHLRPNEHVIPYKAFVAWLQYRIKMHSQDTEHLLYPVPKELPHLEWHADEEYSRALHAHLITLLNKVLYRATVFADYRVRSESDNTPDTKNLPRFVRESDFWQAVQSIEADAHIDN